MFIRDPNFKQNPKNTEFHEFVRVETIVVFRRSLVRKLTIYGNELRRLALR